MNHRAARTRGFALVAFGLALIVCCEDNPWLLTIVDEDDERDPDLRYVAGPQLELPTHEHGHQFWPVHSRMIVATRDGLGVDGKPVLWFADGRIPADEREGHIVPRLYDALARGEKSSVVTLVGDRRLRFATMVDALHTASLAGAWDWYVMVRGADDVPGHAHRSVSLYPPQSSARVEVEDMGPPISLEQDAFTLAILIGEDWLELGEIRHTGEVARLARIPRDAGMDAVRQAARAAVARFDHRPAYAVLGAEPDVELARVLDALAHVEGHCDLPGPTSDHNGCWYPEWILVGGAMTLWKLGAGLGSLSVQTPDRHDSLQPQRCQNRGPAVVEIDMGGGQPSLWLTLTAGDAQTTVTVRQPERLDLALTAAACTTLDATVTRQRTADMWRDEPVLKASVQLDCRLGDAHVHGLVRVSHCPLAPS